MIIGPYDPFKKDKVFTGARRGESDLPKSEQTWHYTVGLRRQAQWFSLLNWAVKEQTLLPAFESSPQSSLPFSLYKISQRHWPTCTILPRLCVFVHIPQDQCCLSAEPSQEGHWSIPYKILVTDLCRCHFELAPRKSCSTSWTCLYISFYDFRWISFTEQEGYYNRWSTGISEDVDLIQLSCTCLHRLIVPSPLIRF